MVFNPHGNWASDTLFSVCSNDHTACTRSFERYPPVVTSLHQEVLRFLLQFHVAPQSGLLKTRTPKSCCASLPGASKGLDGIPFKYTIQSPDLCGLF